MLMELEVRSLFRIYTWKMKLNIYITEKNKENVFIGRLEACECLRLKKRTIFILKYALCPTIVSIPSSYKVYFYWYHLTISI